MGFRAMRSRAVSTCSSRRSGARLSAWVLGLLCLSACGASRPAPMSAPAKAGRANDTSSRSVDSTAGFPQESLELLNESTGDSCSICAEKKRKEAFVGLTQAYAPGTILKSTALRHFAPLAGGEQELTLTDYDRTAPALTFRYHDEKNHLVGIAENDFTDSTLAARIGAMTPGLEFDGAIQIVAFEYGDGPSFLYSRATNHLEVQCRVLLATRK